MAGITAIRFVDIPQTGSGKKERGVAGVRVESNGQISFNTNGSLAIGQSKNIALFMEGEQGKFPITFIMKPVSAETVAENAAKAPEKRVYVVELKNRKDSVQYFSAAGLLGHFGYNYKESGTQGFAIETKEFTVGKTKESLPCFVIGAASFTPRPKAPRKPRTPKVAPVAASPEIPMTPVAVAKPNGLDTSAPPQAPSEDIGLSL